MKYFKSENGAVFAYEADGSQDAYINPQLTQMTEEEVEAHMAPPPVEYPAIIATRRWQAEVAGITVNGMQVDTGRDSQALITGAAVSAMLDPTYSVRWKTAAGFVDCLRDPISPCFLAVAPENQWRPFALPEGDPHF